MDRPVYLLRVVVADRPGSLGALATAIGRAGGDIISLDVVERSLNQGAVDDLLVGLPADDPSAVLAAIDQVGGVELESVRRHPGGEVSNELALVDMLADVATDALALLAQVATQSFKASWALLLEDTGSGVVTRHATAGAPRLRWASVPWLPLAGPEILAPDDAWVPTSWVDTNTAIAATPVGVDTLALLVGREQGPAFRRSEVTRLGHLGKLAATVSHLRTALSPSGARPRPGPRAGAQR